MYIRSSSGVFFSLSPDLKLKTKIELKTYPIHLYNKCQDKMPKLCEYENCRDRATYGLKRNCPLRCVEHKEGMKLACKLCLCGNAQPYFNESGVKPPICCTSCKTETMVNVKSKKCLCGKSQPVFNEQGQKNGVCCASCKTDSMVDVINKKCLCGKAIPIYNEEEVRPAICCVLCKTETMVNVLSKKCKCGKAYPLFNEPGEKKGVCCASCKTESMVDVKTKKCLCGKAQPTFNEPGQPTPICCASCKTKSMVDVISKKCNCGKTCPLFNEPGEKKAVCCASCKTESMVDVISKKCLCGKAKPNFNEPGETTAICCVSCKTESMIDVKHKKCVCGKARPSYNKPGEIIPICCFSCKIESMIDVINKKCNGLTQNNEPCPYNHKANPKYKNYCVECFRRNFSNDPLTFQIRSKTKEIAVRDYINANLEGFHHDKPLTTTHCDCSIRRRIDHRKLINNTLLVIETDENQHHSYSVMDEETRYDDLYMAFSGKWIYIRFNPDKYVAKNGKNKNPMLATRLPVLLDEIKRQITRIENEQNKELVERIYLYYDSYD